MASTNVELLAPTGLTLTLELFPEGSDTIANGAGDTLTEATNRDGLYAATVTEALAGYYYAKIIDGSSNLIAAGWVNLADDTNTYTVGERVVAIEGTKRQLDDLNDVSAAQVNAECDTAISDAALATAASISSLNDISVADVLTTQMVESYATDGTAPTLSQSLFLIQQGLLERAVSGTTETIRKINKTDTAATYTLDDASAPTSKTRAS